VSSVSGVAELGRGVPAPLLRARGLGRSYDDFLALTNLTLEVGRGELVALVGPNGAGKTTFLTLAAGLLEPTSGEVEVEGAAAGSIAARRALSYIPDAPVFYEDIGLAEWEDALPSEFSRGMRQKASIALGLVRPFSVLLADEPLDGLDPPSREVFFKLLAESRAAGAAVVVSTHRPDVIAAASRCLGIREGRLVYDGTPDPEAIEEFFEYTVADRG
jgi:ABC-type multidrug transport system ATPase subunit